MLRGIRLELVVLAVLGVSIAALVWAVQGSGAGSATNGQVTTDSAFRQTMRAVPEGTVEIQIIAFDYDPEPVRVSVGEPIVWTNLDGGVPHTVTSVDGTWDSGMMGQGDTFARSFDEPGVYPYICTLHPPPRTAISGAGASAKLVSGDGGGMHGTVIVE